jgi:hypothetical protein
MPPVNALRWAENRMSAVINPTSDMIAPTTSSLRSGERLAHQETETGSGWARAVDLPFDEAGLLFAFPCEGVNVLPFAFEPDLEVEEGVLRGIISKSIAQMVCFSFGVKLHCSFCHGFHGFSQIKSSVEICAIRGKTLRTQGPIFV